MARHVATLIVWLAVIGLLVQNACAASASVGDHATDRAGVPEVGTGGPTIHSLTNRRLLGRELTAVVSDGHSSVTINGVTYPGYRYITPTSATTWAYGSAVKGVVIAQSDANTKVTASGGK